MNFDAAMKAKGYVLAAIEIAYQSRYDHAHCTEIQHLWVLPVATKRFLIKESSGFLSDYKLFFGDEIQVDAINEDAYRLVSIVTPSAMGHYFCLGSGSPTRLTEGLHELGGEWESEMGGLTVFHVPLARIDEFHARFGIDLRKAEQLFSGEQQWDC